jgi:aspartyl-tRNA(Asn)/glutamyl-tRNA(Gln) amidotransferase subunit A
MELYQLTIQEAFDGLRKGRFSPSEILKSCLDRIKKFNPKLNVFLRVETIASRSQNGALKNIPIAAKDMYLTKNITTTAASHVLENYTPQYHATVIRHLLTNGAVLIGKTNQDAWAHGGSGENSDFGSTINPWDIKYVPGGSSSGSAVAVAADMCLGAMGTDTGGSIRQPASFCNIVGLKPTYGRVSRYGIIAMASSLDTIGHFTKTVYDSALILNVTAGHDNYDATTPNIPVTDYTRDIQKGIKGIKIGIPREYFIKGIDQAVEKSVKTAIKKMEGLGGKLVEISLPHTEYALAVYYIVQPSEVSSNLARYDGIRYGKGRETFGDEAKRRIILGTYTLSAGYYDAYYLQAMKARTLIKKDFESAFKKVDVIIAPVSPTPPFKLGEKSDDPLAMYLADIFTVTANLAGIPSLAVPCGFTGKLPVGMQIMGSHFNEGLLFRVGFAYEQATDWHRRKPNLEGNL